MTSVTESDVAYAGIRQLTEDTGISMQGKKIVSDILSSDNNKKMIQKITDMILGENHLDILEGFICLRELMDEKLKLETKECNLKHSENRTYDMLDIIKDNGNAIKIALLRPPRPECDFHSVGLDLFLDLIQMTMDNPWLFKTESCDDELVA